MHDYSPPRDDYARELDDLVRLLNLSGALAAAADQALDEHDWQEGGACDDIARAMGDVLADNGYEFREGGWEGDDHAYLVVELDNGDEWAVDIPASIYETGGGYSWEPIPDVEILPDHISWAKISW